MIFWKKNFAKAKEKLIELNRIKRWIENVSKIEVINIIKIHQINDINSLCIKDKRLVLSPEWKSIIIYY